MKKVYVFGDIETAKVYQLTAHHFGHESTRTGSALVMDEAGYQFVLDNTYATPAAMVASRCADGPVYEVVSEEELEAEQDLAIAALVKRLSGAGCTLEIGIALNVDQSVDQYRVEWRDEMTEIVTWNEDLLQALIKTDADVAAVDSYGC